MEFERSRENAKKGWGYPLLCLVLLALLIPVLVSNLEILWSRSDLYKWFPLLILMVAAMLLQSWKNGEPAEMKPKPWALSLGLVLAMALTVVAYLYFSGWLAMAIAIAVLGLLLADLSGRRKMPRVLAIWGLLFLVVRAPNQLERRFLSIFQSFSTKGASPAIDYAGHYHVFQGKVLVIDGYEINIAAICNGYFSVIGLVAVAAVYAVLKKRSLIQGILLMAFALAAATFVNIVRIALVGIIYAEHGWNLMESNWLYVMLAGSYALGLLLLMSMDAFCVFLFAPVGNEKPNKYGKSLARLWDQAIEAGPIWLLSIFRRSGERANGRIRAWGLCFLALGIVALGCFGAPVLYYRYGFGEYKTYFMHQKEDLAVVEATQVRFDRDHWKVISVETEEREFSSIWGAYSTIWRLRYHDTMVIMALDYPFDKWHDVKICYGNLGWQADKERLLELKRYTDWGASETEMTLPTGDFGFILCSHCDHEGGVVQPQPTSHQFDMVLYYLHPKQWSAPYGLSVDRNKNTFYQTQSMVTSPFPLDEPTKQEIRLMYEEFREQTRRLIQQKTQDAKSL